MAGDCYRSCCKRVTAHWAREDLLLCHGYPVLLAGPHRGDRFGHAWLERVDPDRDEWMVEDPEVPNGGLEVPRSVYYLLGQIDPRYVRRYTREEAVRFLIETEHWGPWEADPAEYDVRYC